MKSAFKTKSTSSSKLTDLLKRAQETLVKSLSNSGTVTYGEASNFVIVALSDYIVAISNIGLTLQS